MDSYNFHFERMNNLDLHPLGLPVNRLSPAKSGGSIDQFTHHHHHRHGKGDSAYSSFSGGSTAPDYPSPFLPEDLQGGSLHYTDLKYVKAVYHPHQLLPSDARSMDQLYRSVEAISKQYRHSSSDNNNKENNNSSSNGFLANPYSDQEKAPPAPPPMPPPPPARLDSFIATRNLENSRAHHHAPEGQGPGQLPTSRAPAANPEAGGLRADSVYDPVYARRSSQPLLRDPPNPDRTDKSTNVLSRSPPRGTSQTENPKHKQLAAGNDSGGGHFEGHRKRAHSAHGCLIPDPTRSGSPRRASQNLINGSIQHKGQFYFVTGVLNPPESAPKKNVSPCASEAGSESSTVVEIHRLVEREKERGMERERPPPPPYVASDHLFWKDPRLRHQGGLDTADDEREYLAKTRSREDESHGLAVAVAHAANPRVSRSFDALEQSHNKSASRDIGRSHCSNHPIFYCGPEEENSSPPLCTLTHSSPDAETVPPAAATAQANQHKREDQGRRGRRQLLGDVASEKISKETTPLLYHLTGASRAMAPKPKRDVNDVGANGKETARGCRDDRPSRGDAPEEEEDGRHACNTLDDSFKKYYKEKLKDAQSKVLRETSFKRRDLQLSWPHRIRPRPEPRPSVLPPSVCPPQDPPADAPAPSLSSTEGAPRAGAKGEEEEAKGEEERESEERESETNGRRPANVAQPQAARVGGRKRLTSAQKKLCYSEPEKLNRLGDGPAHSACRSLGSEREVRLLGEEEEELGECGEEELGEEGLVAARRKVFETRGRSQSASSLSKSNLKHLQHKALVAYMERKTGQKKVAEPQQPAPQVSGPPAPQRHSAEGKPSDRGPRLPQAYGSQGPKKKLHRPHSAGHILDSSSSSIRYAQFSSAQSSSAQFNSAQFNSAQFSPAQSNWRDTPSPSQGKSASAESLLDQPEPPEFFRNRSISTPHAFQVHNYADDPSSVDTTETSSLQKMADEEASPRPGQAPSNPPEGQRVRVTAQRGKSLEELGVSKDDATATPSVLSKSSEQLAQVRSRQGGPAARDKRNVSFFREGTAREQESVRQEDAHAEKTRLFKQNSAPQLGSEEEGAAPVTTRGPADSGRSTSPASRRSSWARVRSDSPGAPRGSGPPVSDEPGTGEPAIPPSPGDWETGEREKSSSSGLRTTPPVTSEERECSVDEPSETASPSEADQEVVVSLSCGVTTDPSLWIFLPEPGSSSTEEDEEAPPPSGGTVAEGPSPPPASAPQGSDPPTSADADADTPADADACQGAEGQGEGQGEGEGPAEDEANTGEGGGEEGEGPGGPETQKTPEKTPPPDEPRWAELVEEVVGADQSLASVLYPLTNRKTALMLMEQLLSEDTLLMEEHYKKKQEQRQAADSSETGDDVKPLPPPSSSSSSSSSSPVGENPQPPEPPNTADVTEKKRMLVSRIRERLCALEETRGALQAEVGENGARGQAVGALVQQHCQPMELERYHLFIGDLERVVSLLLCLSARLARVQNALSAVNQHTDAEDKLSLDNRHRLLCKQRDDAKDLKDNLDRRERLVSTFLSRRLSAEQLQDYRRFVQTQASLLIRLKDLEEKQRLGEEQLEALLGSLPL